MSNLQNILTASLTGGHRPRKTHRVSGVDRRGEPFSLTRSKADAEDFAQEVRDSGGTATVTRVS